MRRGFQSAIFLLCVLFSVAGAYNVMADNADVEALAQATACGEAKPCKAQKTFMERTPISQTFEFAAGTGAASKRVSVRCARAFVLAGEYTCTSR